MEKYTFYFSQNELDAHWLMLSSVRSHDNIIFDIIYHMVQSMACNVSDGVLDRRYVSGVVKLSNMIDPTEFYKELMSRSSITFPLRKIWGSKTLEQCSSNDSAHRKYIVSFDLIELAIIATVSNSVAGDPEMSYRKYISPRHLRCSLVINTLTNSMKYLDPHVFQKTGTITFSAGGINV